MDMKRSLTLLSLTLLLMICLSACKQTETGRKPSLDPSKAQSQEYNSSTQPEVIPDSETKTPTDQVPADKSDGNGETMIYAHVGDETLIIKPEDNSSAEALIELLKRGDIAVAMHDYGGFEKVGSLGASIPTNDERITTEPGDLILYQGNQITIYYDTNTWSFTRLGKVQGMTTEQIFEVLGDGDPTVVFSLNKTPTDSSAVGVFNYDTRTIMLNSGYAMPILGLGTYALDHDTCVSSVMALLENGGRLIDTAYMYGNEEAVGEGVRRGMEEYGIPRQEIFVITKIYPNQFSDPEVAIDMALNKLDIGYIDMMLLHHPGTNDVKAYQAMEKYVEQGKIRSLGLSNWYVEELTEFLPQVTITPALVQNEIHPYYQEQDVVPFIQEKGIVVQCWYPLGGRGYTADLLGNETIKAIAEAHGVSSAQVILRWDLQRGIVVIPGSSNPYHIRENLDLFGFELTDDEMAKIGDLDRGEKHDWY